MVSGKLDAKEFPFLSKDDEEKFGSASGGSLTPAQSKRKDGAAATGNNKWAQAAKSPATSAKSGKKGGISKYVIFIAGGVTYPEVREAYTKSMNDKVQCYIGSTALLRPKEFVKVVTKLAQGGADDGDEAGISPRGNKSPRSLSGDDDSDDVPRRPAKSTSAKATAKKTSTTTAAKKAGATAAKKRQEESSEEESSDSEDAPRPAKRATAAKKAGTTASSSTGVKKAQPAAKKATPAKKVARRRADSDSDS